MGARQGQALQSAQPSSSSVPSRLAFLGPVPTRGLYEVYIENQPKL